MPPIVQHDPLQIPVLHDYFHRHGRQAIASTFSRLRQLIYTDVLTLSIEGWHSEEPLPFARRQDGEHFLLQEGQPWGALFQCAWFRFSADLKGLEFTANHVLRLDLGGEGCVYTRDGKPVRGITNGTSVFDRSLGEPGKTIVRETDWLSHNGRLDFWVDAACNDLFGHYDVQASVSLARLSIENSEALNLYYDWEVLLDLAQVLGEDSARFHRILKALFEAAMCLKEFNSQEIEQARELLAPELARGEIDPPLQGVAVGHAHMDLAWLWPLRETRRKALRTFSTALRNMERYPEYRFCATQPQLYQWVKEDQPELYEKVRRLVSEGRWEPTGAMWVEADNNLAGGEALVRQFLYGQRFFRDEFGAPSDLLMIPDDFGYSAVLPQLMHLAGVKYLLTTKMSWDEFVPFPYHSFQWKGLDGSNVLVHLPPEGTYNGAVLPHCGKRNPIMRKKPFAMSSLLSSVLAMAVEGPGEEHLERLRRLENLQSLPPTRCGRLDDFFARLESVASKLPDWQGPIFLHKHQGTFTTQGALKKHNRKIEALLRETEFLASLCVVEGNGEYPQTKLEELWKKVLLFQFHDILPGSSIRRVNRETRESYEQIERDIFRLQESCAKSLSPEMARQCVFNPLNWPRQEHVYTEKGWRTVSISPLSYVSISDEQPPETGGQTLVSENYRLENDYLRVSIGEHGFLTSVVYKASNREVLAEGAHGNELAVLCDKLGDAWDFPRFARLQELEKPVLKEMRHGIDGPEAFVDMVWQWRDSRLEQRYTLQAGSPLFLFRTRIDWREDGAMVRARFPVAIKANACTSEIQFGHVDRELHNNDSQARGEFEQYAHRWFDVSESDFGVAILNDGKYGHGTKNNVLDLHLLRSPSYPDPEADRGIHEFTYALFPHQGKGGDGEVARRAYELNHPFRVLSGEGENHFPLSVCHEDIFVENIKKAEDSNDLIVRLYEPRGRSLTASLEVDGKQWELSCCNLLEEDLPEMQQGLSKQSNGRWTLEFSPFQIRSIRMRKNETF